MGHKPNPRKPIKKTTSMEPKKPPVPEEVPDLSEDEIVELFGDQVAIANRLHIVDNPVNPFVDNEKKILKPNTQIIMERRVGSLKGFTVVGVGPFVEDQLGMKVRVKDRVYLNPGASVNLLLKRKGHIMVVVDCHFVSNLVIDDGIERDQGEFLEGAR